MSPRSQVLGWLMVLALCAALPRGAKAYSTPDAFQTNPLAGGGGGRWFTGSPADGYGCSECHTGSETPRFPLLVSGLALDGYEPGESREVVVSWPEFAKRWKELRPDPTQPRDPLAPSPALGLVAEFVAESGKASGTVEIRGASASAPERCEMTRVGVQGRVASRLYQVRPGVAPILIKADRSGIARCESGQLGQRCIVAMNSCGAEQLRIVWKAPPSQEGPIWFSAGFVATDELSGTPDDDSVAEFAMPMGQAGSSSDHYEQTLRNACSVTHVGARSDRGWLVFVFALLACVAAQRSRRSTWLLAIAMLSLSACGIEAVDQDPSHYPSAGLYTPGSMIGASDPTDTPDPNIVYGNRCVSPQPMAGTTPTFSNGELTLRYTTETTMGRYAPRNCSAVWIETIDEQYVATIEIAAQLRRPGLVYWQEQACTEKFGPDVVTSATKPDHTSTHMAKWTGVDLNGVAMPDGDYRLFIEVTESDKEPGDINMISFTKGTTAFDREEPPMIDGLASIHITWTPSP